MMDVVAPGARVVIRDAEWLVRKVDATSTGGYAIHTIGLSELVKNREAIFLSELERDITVMNPAETTLVPDTSPHFRNALLYIESLLRQTPPTDPPSEEKIYLGHRAAMDVVGYQLDPAIQALKQPRHASSLPMRLDSARRWRRAFSWQNSSGVGVANACW